MFVWFVCLPKEINVIHCCEKTVNNSIVKIEVELWLIQAIIDEHEMGCFFSWRYSALFIISIKKTNFCMVC